MGEDAKNEHALGLVVDPGNQPVVVAMDIENGPSTDDVRVREVLPYIGQRFPIRSLGDPIPVEKRDQSILMPSGEFEDGWLADHPHDTSLQNVNLSVKGERCPSRRSRLLETLVFGEPNSGGRTSLRDYFLQRSQRGAKRPCRDHSQLLHQPGLIHRANLIEQDETLPAAMIESNPKRRLAAR
jgi:hypothetical protein